MGAGGWTMKFKGCCETVHIGCGTEHASQDNVVSVNNESHK